MMPKCGPHWLSARLALSSKRTTPSRTSKDVPQPLEEHSSVENASVESPTKDLITSSSIQIELIRTYEGI
jgi:hypothetical protein